MARRNRRGAHRDRLPPVAAALAVAVGAALNGLWRGRDWPLLVGSTLAAFLVALAVAAYLRRAGGRGG
jgi:hypothetical protein